MKKLNVKESACIGCGACIAIDPEHFDFNDNGLSHVISNENIETTNATNAVESCPTNAIEFVEESNDTCSCGEACESNDTCNCGEACECHDCGCLSGEECTCGDNCDCSNCNCQ